jgi:hypothetical protein
MILARDLGIAEHLARHAGRAIGRHAMFVGGVIVVAEDTVLLQRLLRKK